MSDPLEKQLGEEIAARLSVVALLDPAIARSALDDVRKAAHIWAVTIDDIASGRGRAGDLHDALWPNGAPVEWWSTPLGKQLAAAGVNPGGEVSQRVAADLLGWSRHKVSGEFGKGKIKLRAVLDQL